MNQFPMIDMVKTGERIKALRIQSGYAVRELQVVMGFETSMTIYKWQQGKSLPTIDNLVILASIFKSPIEEILVFKNGRKLHNDQNSAKSESSDAEFCFGENDAA